MPRHGLIVLKFGGSVLRAEDDLYRAVSEIDRWVREGFSVIAVTSAFHGRTDQLLEQARRLSHRPDPGALASLVATGEQAAAAALVLALDRAGVSSGLLDAATAGIRADGDPLDATLASIDPAAFERARSRHTVSVVPGFIARDRRGEIVLLGRGGSDYSALFIAQRLDARCRLLKDVAGVFDRDPALPGARRLAAITWRDALALGGRILQPKALRFAFEANLRFEVGAPDLDAATLVGEDSTLEASPPSPRPPLRVALLGAGTVGLGVLRHLQQRSDTFDIVGVACRDAVKAVNAGVPSCLVRTDIKDLVHNAEYDVLVEAIGAAEPAATMLERALRTGCDVVTVNKTALSRHWDRLDRARAIGGGELRFSGAVGGAAPILASIAAIHRTRGVRSVDAVLNGTTNFVLDRMHEGLTLDDALREARIAGFAEADPSTDIDGIDAAEKASIIVASCLGGRLAPQQVARGSIRGVTPDGCALATTQSLRVRSVASIRRDGDAWSATVGIRTLDRDTHLAALHDEWNGALIKDEDGRAHIVLGRGAGRWPTAQAALADLLSLARLRAHSATAERAAS